MILNVCPNNTSEYLRIFLHSLSSHNKGLAGDADRLGFALTDVLGFALTAESRWTRSPAFYDSQGPWTDYGQSLPGRPCRSALSWSAQQQTCAAYRKKKKYKT